LFVLYVWRLHIEIPDGRTLSYVGAFGIMVMYRPCRGNVQLLQSPDAIVKGKRFHLELGFPVLKTD